jgi:quinoprotein glucose dehydrogenase
MGSPKCVDRIFLGTLDARLIALDAATGEPCADFGVRGSVDLTQNVDYRLGDADRITSPPTVIGDVVVVGSSIGDNARVDMELGDVRGFDARSGKLLWTWEPMPWAKGQKLRTGAGNTWSVIAADLEHGLIYLPTSSPSPIITVGKVRLSTTMFGIMTSRPSRCCLRSVARYPR